MKKNGHGGWVEFFASIFHDGGHTGHDISDNFEFSEK